MEFKLKDINIKISFTFLSIFLIFIVTDKVKIYLITLSSAMLHELVHIVFIYLYGMKLESVCVSLFGGNIKRKSGQCSDYKKEAIINLSAPITNIVVGAILSIFYGINNSFALVNLTLGIFNIIPFHTFDGGAGLKCFLSYYFSEKTTENILTTVSVIITLFFTYISITAIIISKNFTLFALSIYMILSLIFKK